MHNPPAPAQTMSLLWQAHRRGRVEELVGPSGGDRAVPKCPSGAAGLWQPQRSVTKSCPLRVAHGTARWQRFPLCSACHMGVTSSATWVSPALLVSPDNDRPPQMHPQAQNHQKWESCRLSRWAPRQHRDGKGRPGPLRDVTVVVASLAGPPRCLGCGSAATSAPDVGSALASLSAQEAPGAGGASGRCRARRHH